jgi:anti-sigma factor RsiW
MVTDWKSPDVIERLNALIDGQLPPSEHAALASELAVRPDLAHAHATLAQLKACIVESAEQSTAPDIVLRKPKPRMMTSMLTAAAAACVLFVVVAYQAVREPDAGQSADVVSLLTRVSLPVAPVIPDLSNAGLKLVGGEVERAGEVAVLVAAYRGPRGCRLELRVWPAAVLMPPTAGTSRVTWAAGDLTYELVAFGMAASRFVAVAAAAEVATRAGQMPREADTRLREASLAAPPCTG